MIFSTSKKCCLAFFTFVFMFVSPFAFTIPINTKYVQDQFQYSNNIDISEAVVYGMMDDCNETAFAFLNNDDDPLTADDESLCFIPQFNRWGWTSYLDFSEETGQTSYILDFYSGAGQCDLSKGSDVGSVNLTYNDDNTLTVNYSLEEGYLLSESHIYIGTDPYPTNNGVETVAPGQYTFTDSDFDQVQNYSAIIPVEGTEFYVIVHGVTIEEDCSDQNCEDSDEDGVCDSDDTCPGFDDTIDSDGDGIPDGCDDDACIDSDQDGVCDTDDICAGHDDTIDTDGDGIPDGCDDDACIDSDQDGVCDTDDICPGHDDTIDSDGDGIPDGCDVAYSPYLFKAYPIPFQDQVNIQYTFDYETNVNLEVFNTKGIKLKEFMNNNYVQGTMCNIKLDLSHVSDQLLFIRLTTIKSQNTKKIVSSNSRPINN